MHSFLQESMVKSMRPACFCALVCGPEWPKAVIRMEDRGQKITWNTFKECGTLFPPKIEDVFRYIKTEASTVTELKRLVMKLRNIEMWEQPPSPP